MKPAKRQFSILKQVCELIPRNMVSKLAKKYGVDKQSRTFTPWSHVVSMIFAQLSHALSLNDIADALSNHKGVLTGMRRAVSPSRNGLSHANKNRNSDMAEALFWNVFEHLYELDQNDIFWVTRSKDNMAYTVIRTTQSKTPNILKDEIIRLTGHQSKQGYPKMMRLITATVELDGEMNVMTFLSNNLEWAAASICDLYKARWAIEAFFKQLKQTLQLADFLGYSKQAVRWQIWTALLTYLLLRFIAFKSKWRWSFARIFTTIRGILWSQLDLFRLLARYGTAHAPPKLIATLYQTYLPGLEF